MSIRFYDRNQGPSRRRQAKNLRRRGSFNVEGLEDKTLLTGIPTILPGTPEYAEMTTGPLSIAGQYLYILSKEYDSFAQAGGQGGQQFQSSLGDLIDIRGDKVLVSVVSSGGGFNQFTQSLRNVGMQITAQTPSINAVEGLAPISQIATLASLTTVKTMAPGYKPVTFQQGSANNQADDVFFGGLPPFADSVRAQFGVNGSGITVGVLSDSANQFGGGLNASIQTGDLPAQNRINVLADGNGGSDEGRAMMELIYDIAPGVNFAFNTAFGGFQSFAAGIMALGTAGAQVIVDDVGYANEAMFQDDILGKAATTVSQGGATYLSAVGNGASSGYESPFRPVLDALSRTFHDFDPGPGVVTRLPLRVNAGGGATTFQWDNPFDGVAGSTNVNLDIIIRDGNGNVVSAGTTNNIATRQPIEVIGTPGAGNYTVEIQLVSGPANQVTRLKFADRSSDYDVNPNGTIQFGTETLFASTFGLRTSTDAIGAAALNFFDAAPFITPDGLINADFSSRGPITTVFDPDGNRLSQPQLRLKPDFSAPQAGNTTFFGGDIQQDPDTLPNFFGTSAAAPNLAAIVALMRQLRPSATNTQIYEALQDSAVFLSSNTEGPIQIQAPGRLWNPAGGFGRVDAAQALANIDNLRIRATDPLDDTTISALPTAITVFFSKAVNPNSVQASDLVITQMPAGVTIVKGAPQIVAGQPNVARFPITLSFTGATANGIYAFNFADNSVLAADDTTLIGQAFNFTLQDTVAPRVNSVSFASRRINVTFDEAIQAGLFNSSNVLFSRNGVPVDLSQATLSPDPSDTTGRRFIIDLTRVPQNQLTTGSYTLTVRDGIRDLVGNALDGEFTGGFPSGNGTAGGNFVFNMGTLVLTAPEITSFQLAAASDSGNVGDENTNVLQPRFIGQIRSDFLGNVANLLVVLQVNSRQPGDQLTLTLGTNNRGLAGTTPTDLVTTTDANGAFSIPIPANLVDGFHVLRIAVVGAQDDPALPGLSSLVNASVRIDTSRPFVNPNQFFIDGQLVNPAAAPPNLSSVSSIQLNVVDPVIAARPTLSVPTNLDYLALNPNSANNITNYRLVRIADVNGNATNANPNNPADPNNFSRFIGAVNFVSTSNRLNTGDPYTGRVQLTINPGLPAGTFRLIAQNLQDAAANILDQDGATAGDQPFEATFILQSQPVYITDLQLVSPDPANPTAEVINGPRAFFEIAAAGQTPRADAPPTEFRIDFSEQLQPVTANSVRLIRSANTANDAADGDFGVDGTTLFSAVPATVTLVNGPNGPNTRLVIRPNAALAPDYYRIILPNEGADTIRDRFGNQLDGEFLGNPRTADDGNGGTRQVKSALGHDIYETLLPTGQQRQFSLSGDLRPGGTFVTGFMVVPNGNVIHARADYVDNPNLTLDDPDGSIEKPYPTLGPEANNNNATNFGTGFRPGIIPGQKDLNGNGRFDRSAFIAARERFALNGGPVVVVARASALARDPSSGAIVQKPFVIQASNALGNDGSVSVPAGTLLAFNPGSTVKLRNAAIFVQNQGSAIQTLGGPDVLQQVNFTSFSDDSSNLGGDTNNDGNLTSPRGGDWGGIVLRNYNDVSNGRAALPARFPVDGKLGLSGADDVMSSLNYARVRYAGGVVPQGVSPRFDSIMLFNSRPQIVNTIVTDTGAPGSTQAAISADFDSFREDDVARGPLVRRTQLLNNSLNGILVRPEQTGVSYATNALFYPNNPAGAGNGAARNFVFDDPLPYLLLSQLQLGTQYAQNNFGSTTNADQRLYVSSGMIVKSQRGAGISLFNSEANDARTSSLIIGDRAYVSGTDGNGGFDATFNAGFNYGPILPVDPNDPNTDYVANPNFTKNTIGDAKAIFTSLYDDLATSFYVDPETNARTTIVQRVDSDNHNDVDLVGGVANPAYTGPRLQPRFPTDAPATQPGLQSRWGGIAVFSGARVVADEAQFLYAGGERNVESGTINVVPAFAFTNAAGMLNGLGNPQGTRVSVTNNEFFDNLEAPLAITPNGLLAGDPLRPLISGNPFFRGNIMQRNTYNGLRVMPNGVVGGTAGVGISDGTLPSGGTNLDVNSVWDDNDLTYILRGTIVARNTSLAEIQVPDPTQAIQEDVPYLTLTIQSTPADTMLADGSRVGRPGESALVKLLNQAGSEPVFGDGATGLGPAGNTAMDHSGGAGWIFGVDDGVDPTPDPLIDPGVNTAFRIVGIPGNETLDQQRVPVIITSLRDDTIGRNIRGVTMNDTFFGDLIPAAPGDGGVISIGANAASDYNLLDPRGGNVIDNADIRFLSRINLQGGGVADLSNRVVAAGATNDPYDVLDDHYAQLAGLPLVGPGGTSFANQNNTGFKTLTITNSNLDSFGQVAVIAHPGFGLIGRDVSGLIGQLPLSNAGARLALRSFGTMLYLSNNVISNMPVGVRVLSEGAPPFTQGANVDVRPSPSYLIMLNNTFFNNPIAVSTEGNGFPANPQSIHGAVKMLSMNNIFSQYQSAFQVGGNMSPSDSQYDVFDRSGVTTSVFPGSPPLIGFGISAPIFGAPSFRNAPAGDFFLNSDSIAVDTARSEITFSVHGNAIQPVSDQDLTVASRVGGTRSFNGRLSPAFGFNFATVQDIVTLAGSFPNHQNFTDGWAVSLPKSLGGTGNVLFGVGANDATFGYMPIQGERDQQGFLRQDDLNQPNSGFGSRPFFDAGALEFRTLFPPHVIQFDPATGTNIQATVVNPDNTVSTRDVYLVNGVAGFNRQPDMLRVRFDNRLDLSTINNQTIRLQASGGDGIFGNNNSSADRFVDLSGNLDFNQATQILTIDLGSFAFGNDLYRVTILGTGSNVVRDEQGNALDGENIGPNGQQLALPSGDGFPGGNFQFDFTIDTTPPVFVPQPNNQGFLVFDPGSDSNIPNDLITTDNTPTFTGQITDVFPPLNAQAGQTVVLEVSPDGNPANFVTAGIGVTANDGRFVVTVGQYQRNPPLNPLLTLPDSPVQVGPDGRLQVTDAGASVARVRVMDQAGNEAVSNTLRFIIDSTRPRAIGLLPANQSEATIENGRLVVTLTASENLDLASFTDKTVVVTASGGDGIFDPGSPLPDVVVTGITVQTVSFAANSGVHTVKIFIPLQGNDVYRIQLVDAGLEFIRDIAGNALDGSALPNGLTVNTIVIDPTLGSSLYVDDNAFPFFANGSRAFPFATIQAAIDAARIGDTVRVLPGTYNEAVTLRSLVQLVSAGLDSTDFLATTGNALQTFVRGPSAGSPTVTARGLFSVPSFITRVSGLTIASPLAGFGSGTINAGSTSVLIENSEITLDRSYIINGGVGVSVVNTTGVVRPSTIIDNVIAGNIVGLSLNDTVAVNGAAGHSVFNNTIVFNTTGVLSSGGVSPTTATLANNIFWQNFSLGAGRQGAAVRSNAPGRLVLNSNLFENNGASALSVSDDTVNVGGAFNPAALTPNGDVQGNFTGAPAFVVPRDPRPEADGPAVFLLTANYDLNGTSAAIDRANDLFAPATDLRFRRRVDVPNRGLANRIADVGAFEFQGGGTTPGGQTFQINSLTPAGRVTVAPRTLTVRFSNPINRSTLAAADFRITGSAINRRNPVRISGVQFLDDRTAVLRLTGTFKKTGTLTLSMVPGSATDVDGNAAGAFSSTLTIVRRTGVRSAALGRGNGQGGINLNRR